MMKNKKLFYGILIGVAIIIIAFIVYIILFWPRCISCGDKNVMNIKNENVNINKTSNIIVKQLSGVGALIRECEDKEYIAKIADYIIEGIVEKMESKWNEEKTFILTYVDLKIEKYVKGIPLKEDKLQIITSGGTVGEISQGVEDQPIFYQGKKVRIYFEETNGEFSIVCGVMGGVEEIKISAQIANPASVYCVEQKGKLEIREDKEGNEYGVCVFFDKSECEEWTFYRNECIPWDEIIKILNSGQVARIRQVSGLEEVKLKNAKELKLKNGKTIIIKEPVIDEIFKEIKKCGDLCKDIDALIE